MVIFHCYVSSPEGTSKVPFKWHCHRSTWSDSIQTDPADPEKTIGDHLAPRAGFRISLSLPPPPHLVVSAGPPPERQILRRLNPFDTSKNRKNPGVFNPQDHFMLGKSSHVTRGKGACKHQPVPKGLASGDDLENPEKLTYHSLSCRWKTQFVAP